jgi:type II secretion system protein H
MAARAVKEKMRTLPAGNESVPKCWILDRRFREEMVAESKAVPGSMAFFPPAILHPKSNIQYRQFRGFTLVEVLLVLLIIGVMISLALPSIGSGVKTLQLHNSARILASTLRYARTKAIREQQVFLLRLEVNYPQVELRDGENKYQRTYFLPGGVTIKKISLLRTGNFPEKRIYTFAFLPNGMSESFEIQLANSKGREIAVIQDNWMNSPRIEVPKSN